jgi:hypothetical protein
MPWSKGCNLEIIFGSRKMIRMLIKNISLSSSAFISILYVEKPSINSKTLRD